MKINLKEYAIYQYEGKRLFAVERTSSDNKNILTLAGFEAIQNPTDGEFYFMTDVSIPFNRCEIFERKVLFMGSGVLQ
jgi:hypothetical protein